MDFCSIYLPISYEDSRSGGVHGFMDSGKDSALSGCVKNPFDFVEHVTLCSDAKEAPPF